MAACRAAVAASETHKATESLTCVLYATSNLGNEHVSVALNLQNLLEDYSDYDKFPSSQSPAVEQNLIAFIELKLKIQ